MHLAILANTESDIGVCNCLMGSNDDMGGTCQCISIQLQLQYVELYLGICRAFLIGILFHSAGAWETPVNA